MPLTPDPRDLAVHHAVQHDDPVVRDAVHALLLENATLREVMAEEHLVPPEPTRRRWTEGRVAALVLAVALAFAALVVTGHVHVRGGESSAPIAVEGTPVAPVVPVAPPAPPAVPAPPAPPAAPIRH